MAYQLVGARRVGGGQKIIGRFTKSKEEEGNNELNSSGWRHILALLGAPA